MESREIYVIADGSPKRVVSTRTVCPEDLQGSRSTVFTFILYLPDCRSRRRWERIARRAIAYYHSAVCQLHYSAFLHTGLALTSSSFISSSIIQLGFCSDKVTSIDLN